MAYILKDKKDTYLVQHLESGSYDFSRCRSFEEAVGEALAEAEASFYQEACIALCGGRCEQCAEGQYGSCEYEADPRELEKEARSLAAATLGEYTPEEVLKAASSGYGWPEALGFVEEVEEVTWTC